MRGAVIARVSGSARAMLSAERVALNFPTHLSGVTTLTARYVAAVGNQARSASSIRARPCPVCRGFREICGSRPGGGANHLPFALDDAAADQGQCSCRRCWRHRPGDHFQVRVMHRLDMVKHLLRGRPQSIRSRRRLAPASMCCCSTICRLRNLDESGAADRRAGRRPRRRAACRWRRWPRSHAPVSMSSPSVG